MTARAFKPRLVHPEPTPEDSLRALLVERDRAAAILRRVDAEIAEEGRAYIAAKYPNAREFVKPSVERLVRELGNG